MTGTKLNISANNQPNQVPCHSTCVKGHTSSHMSFQGLPVTKICMQMLLRPFCKNNHGTNQSTGNGSSTETRCTTGEKEKNSTGNPITQRESTVITVSLCVNVKHSITVSLCVNVKHCITVSLCVNVKHSITVSLCVNVKHSITVSLCVNVKHCITVSLCVNVKHCITVSLCVNVKHSISGKS